MSTESRYSHEYRYRDHRQSSKKAKVAVAEDVRFSSRGGVKTNRSKLRTGGDGRNDRDVYCYFNHLRSSKETNIVEDVRRLASGESSRSVVGVGEGAKGFIAKAFVASLWVYALIATFNYSSILQPFHGSSSNRNTEKVHSPSGVDGTDRRLSLNLGGGDCEWQPPVYNVPTNIDFHKTLIAGYPSGDKRMIFVQMEALSGWPAKDEWDFWGLGDSNHPFIKANYPHHEGVWGWGSNADQVVMMVRNIRKSMVEYHDILWDIGYAKTWDDANEYLENLYNERPPIEDFYAWRDDRVMDEAHWYGWFIDYWMEGGLQRDIFTHKITTDKHWQMLMRPEVYHRSELEYDLVVGADTVVTPNYDSHCGNGEISGGCQPVAVISAEKLRDYDEGPTETEAIAKVLLNSPKMSPYVIASEAWNCIWEELIVNKRGLKTVSDRPLAEVEYNFSTEMLEEMLHELDRLIDKYSSNEWNAKTTSIRLVELLTEHRVFVQEELDGVNSGVRKLTEKDFLGPRERRKLLLASQNDKASIEAKAKNRDSTTSFAYFDAMQREKAKAKRRRIRKTERVALRKKQSAVDRG